MKYLFVCTGNTCRSPLAEAILKKRITDEGKEGEVISGGIMVSEALPASKNAVVAGNELGVDLTKHRSHMLSADDITKSDVVLAMTKSHKNAIISAFPIAKNKTFTLSEYVSYGADVTDPFGGDVETYRKCAEELKAMIGMIPL